jgi:hypothetical protein
LKKKLGIAATTLIVIVLLCVVFWTDISTAFYQNFIAPNPTQDYAKSQNLPSNIIKLLQPLDSNHVMDSSKKAIVDRLNSSLSNIENFDNQSRTKILEAFVGDANFTVAEAHQVHFLSTLPKNEALLMIQNGDFTNFDLNGDGMNNDFELNIANLPYADKPTGRYAIIVSTADVYIGSDALYRFLINDEHFNPSHIIKLDYKDATIENFDKAVSEISHEAGSNDILYVNLDGHGGIGKYGRADFGFNDGTGDNQHNPASIMYYDDMAKKLDSIHAGRTLVTVNSCDSHYGVDVLGNKLRVVVSAGSGWIYNISPNYCNFPGTAPKTHVLQSDPGYVYDSEKGIGWLYLNEDKNGDGYVSVSEMLDFISQYVESKDLLGISDKGNIAGNFYLGDYSILDEDCMQI